MRRSYRETLLEASRVLGGDGDLNMRLTLVAAYLLMIDDDDVPPAALDGFNRVRDPLIAKPLFVKGKMVPRGFDELQARSSARAFSDLVLAELGGHGCGVTGSPASANLPHREDPEGAN